MDIYRAIIAAANRLEADPHLFEYKTTRVHGCGSPACAIGWIGFCAGETEHEKAEDIDIRSRQLLGVGYWNTFEDRMRTLSDRKWTDSASECAAALRLYAAKYHAPAKRTDSELVADLMARIGKQTIPDGEIASPEYARA